LSEPMNDYVMILILININTNMNMGGLNLTQFLIVILLY